jgi:uncharacterized SAM-binding protein YcdF (DUF218 family)
LTGTAEAPADPGSPVGPVDAVLVCAGGRGDRLVRALELMDEGVAPVLVVPHGANPRWPAAVALLGGSFPFELVCPTPRPSKTRGEARLFRDLIGSRGWRRVVLVTSDYHARRAMLLVRRCIPEERADITLVTVTSRIGPIRRARAVVHEIGGLAWALLVRRGC